MSAFLIAGFGVKDGPSSSMAGGKLEPCKVFTCWRSMIERCYGRDRDRRYRSYKGCTVSEEWRLFSSFKAWSETRFRPGLQLDKDLLVDGNRVYGPDFCAFITQKTNSFLTRDGHPDLLPGVIRSSSGKYKPIRYSYINPKMGKQEDLEFETEVDAHIQWRANKHEIAIQLAETESDPRVVVALLDKWRG